MRVVYIVKMYPRFSETFIVNEILAHEKAGLQLDIYSLRAPVDGRFHDSLSRVQANVKYIKQKCSAQQFWEQIQVTSNLYPGIMSILQEIYAEKVQDIFQALLIAQDLANSKASHIHVHFANVAASVARIVAAITGLPYTLTTHAKDIYHDSVNEADLEKKINGSRQTIAISHFNLDNLHSRFPHAKEKIKHIYNGLDLNQFEYNKPDGHSTIILAVGRLIEKKGFADLIQACANMKRAGADFSCYIIGAGALYSQLHDLITSLSLADHVKLLGPQPQWKVIDLMNSARMFVAPCIVGSDGNRDGLPTVLLEAMALGTPSISTNVTAIPELIANQKSGIITEQNNPEMLAKYMQQLLDEDELCVTLSRNARKKIEANFDITSNACSLRRLFVGYAKEAEILAS